MERYTWWDRLKDEWLRFIGNFGGKFMVAMLILAVILCILFSALDPYRALGY